MIDRYNITGAFDYDKDDFCIDEQQCDDGAWVKHEDIKHLLQNASSNNALYDALAALVHLHGCEQEGIESGMPTPDQWEQAVDNAVRALKGARREE